jgi:exodeoxyribonuclease-1
MSDARSILWYDLETFGTNPQYDRIAQFAAVRTNLDLEPVGEPTVLYSRITEDYLPDPLACLITGITPQQTLEKGLSEHEFIDRIQQMMMEPGTCTAGYNSIRFDDEFIRNALYRNFQDPYLREYANGNSRWDILDVLRAAHDLRPEGINWPVNELGRPSFRLEAISEANGLTHEHAHDALSDVFATIETARLVRTHQRDLYEYAFKNRSKRELKKLVDVYRQKPVLHTSSIYTSEYGCTAFVMPIAADPRNSNAVYCFDLSQDPDPLIHADPDQIRSQHMLTRIGLNKSPFISPLTVLTDEVAQRLHINVAKCREHYKRIRERTDLPGKIHSAFGKSVVETIDDPDFQIYSGGFFSDADRDRFSIIRNTPADELLSLNLRFDDPRVPEMLWRYTCRNFPEVLDEKERQKWLSFAASRLLFPPDDVLISFQFYTRKIEEKLKSKETDSSDKIILTQLLEYGKELKQRVLKAM